MWPNSGKMSLNEDRLKEYQRQQEKLKAMASSTDRIKPVSADVMIENVLKQTFKKPSQSSVTNIEKPTQSDMDLPGWLQLDSSLLPAHYKHLWTLVQSSPDFADTQKVFKLLITSGLHTDVLGYIWNLANKSVPGQLTKQEFYIVLALVGLAQTGCTFNDLSVLNLIPSAPIPVLQSSVLESSFSSKSNLNSNLDEFQQLQNFSEDQLNKFSFFGANISQNVSKKIVEDPFTTLSESSSSAFNTNFSDMKSEQKEKTEANSIFSDPMPQPRSNYELLGISKSSNFPCIGSSPTAELEDDFTDFQSVPVSTSKVAKPENKEPTFAAPSDDFTDFQSADVQQSDPLEAVIVAQKREIPRIPLPKNLTGKLTNLKTNILKISPESERKLKILSQPESLSSLPESKISSSNKVSTMPSIAVVGCSRGIGSRLANHSLSTKPEKPKHHHKHHKVKLPLNTVEEVLAPVKPIPPPNVDDLFPKCYQKNGSKTFFLKETRIRSNDEFGSPDKELPSTSEMFPPGNNTRRIEIPMLGTFNETVLPTQAVHTGGLELFSMEEDKYSALREVQLESEKVEAAEASTVQDDFGDFLCADVPNSSIPSSAVPSSAEPIPPDWTPTAHPLPVSTLSVDSMEAASSIVTEPGPSESWGDWNFSTEPVFEQAPTAPETQLEDKFESILSFDDLLHLKTEEENKQTESPERKQSAVISFTAFEDDKLDWLSSQDTPKTIQLDISQEDDFGEFLTPDLKPSADALSRHSSLPSLDLKMSPNEESGNEVTWRRCLECCLNLLQEALELFAVCTKTVLDEVFSTQEAADYMNNLNIVYHVARRVCLNLCDFPSIQQDIEKTWRKLDEYCFEYDIKLREDLDSQSRLGSQCAVCLGSVGSDVIDQGIVCYHPTCANLWVNCIEATLPCTV